MTSLGWLSRYGGFMMNSKSSISISLLREFPVMCSNLNNSVNNASGNLAVFTRHFCKSWTHFSSGASYITTTARKNTLPHKLRSIFNKKSQDFPTDTRNMGYFVIGVSGITCGGKTTLTKLLLRKFPWAQVIHQDHYFFDDNQLDHLRVPEAEMHVNYEILEALDMPRMYKDVQAILDAPPKFAKRSPEPLQNGNVSGGVGDKAETPNFDETFLLQIPDINCDVSKYEKVPILIIEGFTIFASQFLYEKCHARFFCSLDKETCRQRRALRTYFPPDTPSYFETIIWPEYLKHYENYIDKRSGVTVFDGNTLMADLWKASVQIITCRIEEKFNGSENASSLNIST